MCDPLGELPGLQDRLVVLHPCLSVNNLRLSHNRSAASAQCSADTPSGKLLSPLQDSLQPRAGILRLDRARGCFRIRALMTSPVSCWVMGASVGLLVGLVLSTVRSRGAARERGVGNP